MKFDIIYSPHLKQWFWWFYKISGYISFIKEEQKSFFWDSSRFVDFEDAEYNSGYNFQFNILGYNWRERRSNISNFSKIVYDL